MADDQKPAPARFVRSKDFRVAYSNTFRLRAAVHEASITFGYQTEVPAPVPDVPSQPVVQDEVEIVLGPVSLKVLHKALGDYVEILEAQLGAPVSVPQEVLDQMNEAKVTVLGRMAPKR